MFICAFHLPQQEITEYKEDCFAVLVENIWGVSTLDRNC
jgi:hypothetical protein